MRIGNKNAVQSYMFERDRKRKPQADEKERFERHLKETRDVLLGGSGSRDETFAKILEQIVNGKLH